VGRLLQMNGWTVRQKVIVLFAVMIVNFVGGVAWFYMTDAAAGLIVGMVFVMAAAVGTGFVRCPRCGNPVCRHRREIGGVAWTYWGFPPKNCEVCGWNLSEPYTARARTNTTQSN
jgi:hypothetical protein